MDWSAQEISHGKIYMDWPEQEISCGNIHGLASTGNVLWQRDLSEVQFTGKTAKEILFSNTFFPSGPRNEPARAGLLGCRGLPLRVTY